MPSATPGGVPYTTEQPETCTGGDNMRRILLGVTAVCAVALVSASYLTPVGAQAQNQALVIQGATLIDGNGGAPVPNSVIVIQGNMITAVGRQGQVQTPAGAQVV